MDEEVTVSGFFLNRDVAIVFALLFIFSALTYFAVSIPSVILGVENEAISWLITLIVLYLEAVIVASLYHVALQ